MDDIFLPDLLEALKWFRLAAEQGNAQAQVLASLTNAQVLAKKANRKNREDLHDDDFKKWWDLTINQNQQNGRSFSYARSPFNDANNEGIDHLDYQCLWALTAGQRHTLARFNLGNGYDNGEGVLQDNIQAQRWWWIAARAGLATAEYNFALTCESGNSPHFSNGDALDFYYKAAKKGHVNAQYNLAVMYENCKNVTQDIIRAYMWYSIASANGSKDASRNRDILAKKMTAKEVHKFKGLVLEEYWEQPLDSDCPMNLIY